MPFLRVSLPSLRVAWRTDLLAGATVTMLLVPQAMAYAQLAGLPPHYGLYGAWLPGIVAALFGRCAQLHTGPVAIQSLLTATVLAGLPGLAAVQAADRVAYAAALALLSGAILLVLGVLRLATLVNLLSHPAVMGFTSAAALVILASQIGPVLQVPMPAGRFLLLDAARVLGRLPEANAVSLLFALGTFGGALVLRRACPRWPGVLLAVVGATAASAGLGAADRWGLAVVGPIPQGLPRPVLPCVPASAWIDLLPGAFVIATVGFVEVLSICKAIGVRTRTRQDFNQELIAQGLANLAGGAVQSYPVSGSFSRSALNLLTGARTGLVNLACGALVTVILLAGTPLLRSIPRAVLGAVIMLAVSGLIDFASFGRMRRASRADGAVAWVTFAATLALAPHIAEAVLAGAALALAVQIYRLMKPHVALLARHPDGTLRDAARHGLTCDPRILALRFDGRLIFTNASHFEERLIEARAGIPEMRAFLLNAEGINDIDASGEEMLRRVIEELRSDGTRVAVARLRGRALDVFRRTGLDELVGADNLFPTAEAALDRIEKDLAAAPPGNWSQRSESNGRPAHYE